MLLLPPLPQTHPPIFHLVFSVGAARKILLPPFFSRTPAPNVNGPRGKRELGEEYALTASDSQKQERGRERVELPPIIVTQDQILRWWLPWLWTEEKRLLPRLWTWICLFSDLTGLKNIYRKIFI